MINTSTKLISGALMVYILLVFLATSNTTIGYAILSIVFLLAFLLPIRKYYTRLPKSVLYCLFIVALCIVASFIFAEYIQKFTIACFGCLIIMYLLTESCILSDSLEDKPIVDWFYILLFSLTLVNIYFSLGSDSDIVFSVIGEKNYTAVFVFCVFLYSNKRRYYSGILLGIIYGIFFTESRSFLLLLILFYILWFLPDRCKDFLEKHRVRFFFIFIILFVAVAVFSIYWVYNVSTSGLVDYKTGLNDGSNRMRFVANIKAFQMLSEPTKTLFWGYGDHLLEALGVTSDDYSYHTHFLGVRLVQPHNSLINPLVTMGIVPGIIYCYILSLMIDKYNSRDNIPYIFPYVINAMIMHSMFELQWLVFWTLILALPQQDKRCRVVIVYGKGKKKR